MLGAIFVCSLIFFAWENSALSQNDLPFECERFGNSESRLNLDESHYDLILECFDRLDLGASTDQLIFASTLLSDFLEVFNDQHPGYTFVHELHAKSLFALEQFESLIRNYGDQELHDRSEDLVILLSLSHFMIGDQETALNVLHSSRHSSTERVLAIKSVVSAGQ